MCLVLYLASLPHHLLFLCYRGYEASQVGLETGANITLTPEYARTMLLHFLVSGERRDLSLNIRCC